MKQFKKLEILTNNLHCKCMFYKLKKLFCDVCLGKTKFYEGLQAGNFKELVEMAGVCNICTENGTENFAKLNVLLASLEEHWHKHNTTQCPIPDLQCSLTCQVI